MKVTLKLSSLNVKDFKANHIFCKYLADTSNISFFHELWLKPSEINLLKNIFPHKNKTILFKSDMSHNNTKGRPFGGQCWIFDSYFKVSENEFLNKHLSYVIFKFNSFEFAIIGTHMPFDDSNNRDSSKCMYELTLSIMAVLIEKFKTRNIPFIIAGDMNADIFRGNRFDKILANFSSDHDLVFLDQLCTQKIPHTFSSHNSVSNIDHILIQAHQSPPIFTELQCNIDDDIVNLSDHRNIYLDFSFESSPTPPEIPPKPPFKNINFEDPNICSFFNKNMDSKIGKIINTFSNSSESNNKQEFINKYYKSICDSFADAFNETHAFQEKNLDKNILNPTKKYKISWFTPELKSIRDKIRILHRCKNPQTSEEKKELKKYLKKSKDKIFFYLKLKN